VHQIAVDRYVKFNKDVWRVECVLCGIAADELGINEASQVARVLARRICAQAPADGSGDRTTAGGVYGLSLSDQQIIAMWASREPPVGQGHMAAAAPPSIATLGR
jgi:hypothetical protein